MDNRAIGKKPNFYEILGLDRNASEEEIHSRYRELSEEYLKISQMDPWFPIHDSILDLTRAYETLSVGELRKSYDKKIDFDIVVLDKEIDKTELADISLNYKRYCATHYEDLVNRFNLFKQEMNESLWLIKTTSIFLVFDVITSVVFTFVFYEYTRMKYHTVYNSLKPWAFSVFVFFIYLQFILFRYLWQLPRRKSLFKNS